MSSQYTTATPTYLSGTLPTDRRFTGQPFEDASRNAAVWNPEDIGVQKEPSALLIV